MSEKKDFEINKDGQTLDIDQAKNMTVGEAVRKDSELKAGITDQDSVLDKYIKQHREEVASKKFETKLSELETLDTASLDKFIQKQRQELAKAGLIKKESSANETLYNEETSSVKTEEVPVPDTLGTADTDFPKETLYDKIDYPEGQTFGTVSRGQANSRKKKKVIPILLAILFLALVVFLGVNFASQSNSPKAREEVAKQVAEQEKENEQAKKAKANAKAFNSELKAFYSDDKQTKLKNDHFDKLTHLEKILSKLKKTAYYDNAKEKFDLLSKQIVAIKAVNGKFATEVIKDGEKIAATVKSGVHFDDLQADILKTGNASLDSMLQSAISDGRKQLSDKEKSEKEAAAKAAEEKQAAESAAANQASAATSSPLAGQSPANPGVALSQYAGLQRDLSRVPYNNVAIADSGNPAWLINPGVLERIIATSQARGYFTGSNYIIEPVNIINGNGYYNMFKTDGTYLFSINGKTGYFVGNAKGNADALDY
ncbi:hypothetical protein DIX90_07050 [Streptococcus iniae]|uniref:cell division site-positioning protein MapZ family protein n=1 Tax=Streptococcus iniae TaxID=1346 RepID=UPI000EF7323C|nr:cell division site-positioning protein MapZ family protein [Streptococcus iniae]ELY5747861.1 hypothetical protein [Streptococcus iniae]RLU59506.1 hypothetical protein DIY02_07255 [Streptococcus iniae]RLU61351.1 hypothetical protein DIY01_07080 [Streptococcus iniae]RLU69774.1 hypothetical protein DIX97_07255 [Streptococcus iniae]RLU83737.1 hypothetical protein DIX91_07055 [Streptococcus iniae]